MIAISGGCVALAEPMSFAKVGISRVRDYRWRSEIRRKPLAAAIGWASVHGDPWAAKSLAAEQMRCDTLAPGRCMTLTYHDM